MPFLEQTTRPRVSVVVPVHRVIGYLRECLESVLRQSFRDFELVVVDDASPDGCGRLIDDYASSDGRVVPVHLEKNVGIGGARNIGVERATGEYLLFLDGDDTLVPGALEAIVGRLGRTGNPDILLYDHVRTYWWGEERAGAAGEMLRAGGTDVFDALSRPEYLRMFAVVWNRVFRRDFYVDGGFAFTDGLYEDALLVYRTLLSAERIACLDQVCVAYRQRHRGSSIRTPGLEHFAIFDQYDRLNQFLAGRPHLEPLRPLVFERMINHFVYTLGRKDRLPASARRAFFRAASRRYRRLRPSGFRPPAGGRGVKFRLLGLRSYDAYRLLKLAGGTRTTLRGGLRRLRTVAGRGLNRCLYRLQLRRPLDEHLAVYSAYWSRGYAGNPAAVHRTARELAPHIRGIWVVRRGEEDRIPAGVDRVVAGSRRYWKVMARAKYFVNNVNFPNSVVKRSGQIHVQTHHGTPLKHMGIDQQAYPATAMDFEALLRRAERWDVSISSNPHSSEIWERVYPCGFESLETGYPRNDVYFTATAEDVRRARTALGIAEGQTAILYAPTVRDYQKEFRPRLELARLCRELGPDHILLVRAHYFYDIDPHLQALQQQGLVRDVSRHPVLEELCLAADALITDYSSVMFDYACLDRPIVVHAEDWEVYRQARGVYFDLLSGRPGDTPGCVSRDTDELVRIFRTGAWNGTEAARLRKAFRQRFVTHDDGHAAERVVRRVFLGERELPAVVPLDRRSPAPAPDTLVRSTPDEASQGRRRDPARGGSSLPV